MLTVKRLKELLTDLPDDATVLAYEGEGIGLIITYGQITGWIDTSPFDDEPVDESLHDLGELKS